MRKPAIRSVNRTIDLCNFIFGNAIFGYEREKPLVASAAKKILVVYFVRRFDLSSVSPHHALVFIYFKLIFMVKLSITTVTGTKLKPFITDLAQLRIEVFREFPYLYDGNIDYEESYLDTYLQSDKSIAVLAFDKGRLVGASTGLPMDHEVEDFKRPFVEQVYDPSTVFYCGESILKKEYRGRGIYRRFFEERESHAKRLGGFRTICFCAVQRPAEHPLRPDHYQPLDPSGKSSATKSNPN